jgi:hypothetical protein
MDCFVASAPRNDAVGVVIRISNSRYAFAFSRRETPEGEPFLCRTWRQAREHEMLFVWDNGGRLQHRSDPSQRLQRAARSPYGLATLVAAHLIAPLTGLTTRFSSIVPAFPVRLNTQHDLNLSR